MTERGWTMIKLFTGTVVGVFIGAFAFEIANRKFPNQMRAVEDKASEWGEIIKSSFVEEEEGFDDIIREDD